MPTLDARTHMHTYMACLCMCVALAYVIYAHTLCVCVNQHAFRMVDGVVKVYASEEGK